MPFDLAVVAEDVQSYKPAHAHWERFFEATTARARAARPRRSEPLPRRRSRKELGLRSVWINRLGEQRRARARPRAARPLRAGRRARRAGARMSERSPFARPAGRGRRRDGGPERAFAPAVRRRRPDCPPSFSSTGSRRTSTSSATSSSPRGRRLARRLRRPRHSTASTLARRSRPRARAVASPARRNPGAGRREKARGGAPRVHPDQDQLHATLTSRRATGVTRHSFRMEIEPRRRRHRRPSGPRASPSGPCARAKRSASARPTGLLCGHLGIHTGALRASGRTGSSRIPSSIHRSGSSRRRATSWPASR